MPTRGVKLGLFLPPAVHDRMKAAFTPAGVSASYARAFVGLLDALDAGERIAFVAVRGPKRRITVRLDSPLSVRLRRRVAELNLKITDFACAAAERALTLTTGPEHG